MVTIALEPAGTIIIGRAVLLFFTLEALEDDDDGVAAEDDDGVDDDDDEEEEEEDGDSADTLRPENDLPVELGEAILECAAA